MVEKVTVISLLSIVQASKKNIVNDSRKKGLQRADLASYLFVLSKILLSGIFPRIFAKSQL